MLQLKLSMWKKQHIIECFNQKRDALLLGIGRRQLEAFTLAPAKADIVPIRHLVLVNTNSPSTSVCTSIKLRDTADCNTGIMSRVLRERAHLLQHPLRSADSLADENLVWALLASAGTLEPLLLRVPPLHPDGLPCDDCRDRRPQQGPPNVHHCCVQVLYLLLLFIKSSKMQLVSSSINLENYCIAIKKVSTLKIDALH